MHHTKFKADIGLAKVIADLTTKGHIPCVPLSEHQPYDLVVVLKNSKIVRVQVKYSHLRDNGTIEVKSKTSWADKNGNHDRKYSINDFEYYAIYCPEKEKIIYISNGNKCPNSIRFDRPANNQKKFVKWADAYLDIIRESSETKSRTPEMAKT